MNEQVKCTCNHQGDPEDPHLYPCKAGEQGKWTPGPWKREGRFIVDEHGQLIATFIEGDKRPWEANLTLALAAPGLVEALQSAECDLEALKLLGHSLGSYATTRIKIRSALRRAGALPEGGE